MVKAHFFTLVFLLSVTQAQSNASPSSSSRLGSAIGGAIGGVTILAAIGFFIYRRYRHSPALNYLRGYRAFIAFTAFVNGTFAVVTGIGSAIGKADIDYLTETEYSILAWINLGSSVAIVSIYMYSARASTSRWAPKFLRACVILAIAVVLLYINGNLIHNEIVMRSYYREPNGIPYDKSELPDAWNCSLSPEYKPNGHGGPWCYIKWSDIFLSLILATLIVLEVVSTLLMGGQPGYEDSTKVTSVRSELIQPPFQRHEQHPMVPALWPLPAPANMPTVNTMPLIKDSGTEIAYYNGHQQYPYPLVPDSAMLLQQHKSQVEPQQPFITPFSQLGTTIQQSPPVNQHGNLSAQQELHQQFRFSTHPQPNVVTTISDTFATDPSSEGPAYWEPKPFVPPAHPSSGQSHE